MIPYVVRSMLGLGVETDPKMEVGGNMWKL